MERSGSVSGSCRKTMERSAEREVTEQERTGEWELQKAEREWLFRHSRSGSGHML